MFKNLMNYSKCYQCRSIKCFTINESKY